jgi:hypothetical protein
VHWHFTHVHTHIHMPTLYIHFCTLKYIYAYIYVCACVRVCARVCACVCVCICIHANVYRAGNITAGWLDISMPREGEGDWERERETLMIIALTDRLSTAIRYIRAPYIHCLRYDSARLFVRRKREGYTWMVMPVSLVFCLFIYIQWETRSNSSHTLEELHSLSHPRS